MLIQCGRRVSGKCKDAQVCRRRVGHRCREGLPVVPCVKLPLSDPCVHPLGYARQDFAEHFHTLECGHRPSQALDSADRISAPLN